MSRSIKAALLAAIICAGFYAPRATFASTNVALPMTGCPPLGNEIAQVMVDVDGTFARSAPSWDAPTLSRVLKFQCFYAVARAPQTGFLLVRDGQNKLWLPGTDVNWRGDLEKLPLSDEKIGSSAGVRIPKGIPPISGRARAIYANAVGAGRNPYGVSVIGDCNSEHNLYFARMASDAQFASVAQRFATAFARPSLAVGGSFNTESAFDAAWSNPAVCGSASPLQCELSQSNASILIIALGTGDQFSWQGFEGRYRRIIDYTLQQGVLPVLMTKADALETAQGGAPAETINTVIRNVGATYGVPVIDQWLATRDLPNNGLENETPPQFHLSADGVAARVAMTLATLDGITRGTYYQPTAPVSVAPVSASAAPASGSFVVNVASANVRAAPSTGAAIIGAAAQSQTLTIVGRSSDAAWWQIDYNGAKGWIYAALGSTTATDAPSAPTSSGTTAASGEPTFTVSVPAANVRAAPNTGAEIVGVAYQGRGYRVSARNADSTWLKIESGWVFAALGSLNVDASAVNVE
jgi:uncharacterized protein YraI